MLNAFAEHVRLPVLAASFVAASFARFICDWSFRAKSRDAQPMLNEDVEHAVRRTESRGRPTRTGSASAGGIDDGAVGAQRLFGVRLVR